MNKNCSRCKYFESSYGTQPEGYILLSNQIESCLGSFYGICKNSKNDIMKKWWHDNGNLPINESTENLPCYQATDLDNLFDKAIELADKMLKEN